MQKVNALALSVLLISTGLSAVVMARPVRAEALPAASAPVAGARAAQGNTAQAIDAASPYDVSEFYCDPMRYKIGDVVPDLYRSKEYQIDAWKIRNLPAPNADSHWTYMGGFYVLISNDGGIILRILNSKIFY